MEKGGSPLLLDGTSIPLDSAYWMSVLLEVRSHSLQGEMTFMSGFNP